MLSNYQSNWKENAQSWKLDTPNNIFSMFIQFYEVSFESPKQNHVKTIIFYQTFTPHRSPWHPINHAAICISLKPSVYMRVVCSPITRNSKLILPRRSRLESNRIKSSPWLNIMILEAAGALKGICVLADWGGEGAPCAYRFEESYDHFLTWCWLTD